MSGSVRSIGIVLAVYNGKRFLAEQLDSIVAQENRKWSLYIRDDRSDDDSPIIVEKFSKMDRRIHILKDSKGNLGSRDNFSSLLQLDALASHDYVAFADQDDVWQHDKLAAQWQAMQKMEYKSSESALLVHSDMTVVDASLKRIAPSFMAYQGIRHENNALSVLLTQNFVPGCTMLVNRRLLDIALPVPEEALMHDWWLALCAAVYGEIGYIDRALVKYRQHGSNEIGAKHIVHFMNPFRTSWIRHWLTGRDNLARSINQARVLAEQVKRHNSENRHLEMIEAYASILSIPWWRRIQQLKKYQIHCQSKLIHYLMISRLLTLPRQSNV